MDWKIGWILMKINKKLLIVSILSAITILVLTCGILRQNSILANTKIELSHTSNELNNMKLQLDNTNAQLDSIQIENNKTKAQLTSLQISDNITKTQLITLLIERNNLKTNYDRLTTGYGYVFKDPTYQEMKAFLTSDKTNSKMYIENIYTCGDFCASVINNASKVNIRCGYVSIWYSNSAHAIVVFNTTDKGLVFIEPQEDEEVKLQVGKSYSSTIIVTPGYYYSKPSYNDIVLKYTIIW